VAAVRALRRSSNFRWVGAMAAVPHCFELKAPAIDHLFRGKPPWFAPTQERLTMKRCAALPLFLLVAAGCGGEIKENPSEAQSGVTSDDLEDTRSIQSALMDR
jgi:hypothetical protein